MSAKEVEAIEIYDKGRVELRVYRYSDPTQNDCWLKIGGCCGLQFHDIEFRDLVEVIDLYKKNSSWRRKLWNKIIWKLVRRDS